MVLTPEGKIAQYYYGVEFAPKDLRLGLIQASQNKIGTVVDQVLLYCYHYDPDTGKYGAIISRVLQLAAGATVLILGTFLVLMFRMGPNRGRTSAYWPTTSDERPKTNFMFDNFPLWPTRASTGAGNVDALYIFLLALSALMCAAIFTMILVFATKYRRRRGVEAEQIEGSPALEITVLIIPLGIFMVIFFGRGDLLP